MSEPNGEVELYEVSAAFWDREGRVMREGLLLVGGYENDFAELGAGAKFANLTKIAQRVVVRQIGGILAQD